MRFLSRYKVVIWFLFTVILIGGLSTAKLASHASGVSPKLSQKTSVNSTKPASNCGTWSSISSPNPGSSDELNSVVAISVKNVWAVGGYNSNNIEQTLIEHWDGTSWSIVPSPNAGVSDNFLLSATHVPGTNQVWAVGRDYDSSGILQETLIERWDGVSWSIVPSANIASVNNRLYGVTAISANNIWAIGSSSSSNSEQTLIEHWDGKKWNIIASPNIGSTYGRLDGITAISGSSIWAVGYYINSNNIEQTLIEHWNGKKWSIVPSPNVFGSQNDSLVGIVRNPGTNQIWAVGYYGTSAFTALTLIEHWDGVSWSIIPSSNPGTTSNFTFNMLLGITAISANNIWAVGSYYNANGYQPLIEHWNGTSWGYVSSPNPGAGQTELAAVTKVPGTSQAWAVGFYGNSGPPQILTEFYC